MSNIRLGSAKRPVTGKPNNEPVAVSFRQSAFAEFWMRCAITSCSVARGVPTCSCVCCARVLFCRALAASALVIAQLLPTVFDAAGVGMDWASA